MIFSGLPDFGIWTSAIHGAVFTGMCVMGFFCCIGVLVKAALCAVKVAPWVKCSGAAKR